jgi:DNA-binding CsgD family transcriptional regulator
MSDIFGRESELETLRRFVNAIPEGPSALVLEGEPGIGKTTLWNAGVGFAKERSLRVLACRSAESEAKLSYAGLLDLLREVPEDALGALPDPQGHALEVALLRADPGGVPVDRRTVSAATLGVLRWLAASSPVVVALDDPQWMDAASANALGFAVRRLESEPVGVLAAVRPREGPDPLDLGRAIANDRLHRVPLGPLSEEALHRLVRERLGEDLPGKALLELHAVSRGNPLFALEVGRASSGSMLRVPRDLRKQVKDRLDALPRATRAVLLAAAALPRPTLDLVDRAVAAEGEAVAPAFEAGILEVDGDALRFTHPLYASVAYADSPVDDRRRIHRRLAELVADPEERARHLALSTASPDPRVAESLEEAAGRARSRGAPIVATELSLEAVRFTPEERQGDRRRRTIAAADHLYACGTESGRAAELLRAVLAECPPGTERAGVRWRIARILTAHGRNEDAELLLRQALEEVGDDAWLEAAIYRMRSWAAVGLYRYGRVPELARAGLAAAERVGEPLGLSSSLAVLAQGEMIEGRGLAADLIERALALWPADDRLGPTGFALAADEHPGWAVGWHFLWADRLDDGRAAFEAALRTSLAWGSEEWRATMLGMLAFLELRAGNWRLAADRAEEAVRVLSDNVIALLARGAVRAHLGEVEAARADLGTALADAEELGWLDGCMFAWPALGMLELSLGDPAAANRWLSRATEVFMRSGIREPGVATFLPDAVEALAALGDLAEAERLTDWLEERGRALDRVSALAAGARCRGLLIAAKGDLGTALEHLERGMAEHDRLPMPFERARTLLVLGTVRRHAKRKRAAREALTEALAIFDGLGARLWAEKARAELSAIGGRAPGTGALTPTEERVARLAAAGHTNREIAETLFLSVRTVEGHLSHAYHKLGVRSRTELAFALDPAEA